ncbi:MAG: hypothetical protein KA713_01030 [Chryseotalea sp. WA131a]|nr:MAG: hypothetical protein KA713_01030 [Chryseotalea sp. WA131a]
MQHFGTRNTNQMTARHFMLFGLIAVVTFSCSSKEYEIKDIINKIEFQDLHKAINAEDSLKNVALLPDTSFIVINGIVINFIKRTYGQEPDLGFYNEYYKDGSKNKYMKINEILDLTNSHLDSAHVFDIIHKMKSLGINDIVRSERDTLLINYRWDVSAMHGETGLIYSTKNIFNLRNQFGELEKIKENWYYFSK